MYAIAEDVALAQSPISNEDLVISILNGLGPDYSDLTSAIRVRTTALPMVEHLNCSRFYLNVRNGFKKQLRWPSLSSLQQTLPILGSVASIIQMTGAVRLIAEDMKLMLGIMLLDPPIRR
ncbi:unnamed protein product [Cuscuta europaea]|uniref:Uncharacterized protein n=1 Tax=Cuscuta europaea TaxID=41803 RepID=A0A9P0ZSS6_CUSEU|nr:unnamed protein product [Cuscuta europaea]